MKMLAKSLLTLLCVVSASTSFAAEKDIVDTAVAAGNFTKLAAALGAADLADTLKSDGPFTVFAPTDEAFAKLPAGTVETLLKPENKALLTSILTYHVVPGEVMAKDVMGMTGGKTVNGQYVDVSTKGKTVMIDKAKVVKADIKCTNGVIHVIDTVLMPTEKNIVEVADSAGSFTTLIAAAQAAGLAGALTGEGPLTVFAPTDAAFAKLPAGTVTTLLKPENKAKLAAILKYHVVSGRVYSPDALKAKSAETLEGSKITFMSGDDGAMVNKAKLVKTDIDASNGVIHVIDTVLMPKM